MRRARRFRRFCLLTPTLGVLFVSSCLAAMERNVDILLSPAAAGNIEVVPYSAVAGLLDFLVRLTHR
jgi:hypothetical protein